MKFAQYIQQDISHLPHMQEQFVTCPVLFEQFPLDSAELNSMLNWNFYNAITPSKTGKMGNIAPVKHQHLSICVVSMFAC